MCKTGDGEDGELIYYPFFFFFSFCFFLFDIQQR